MTAILVGIGFAVGYFVRGGTRHSGQGDQGEEINRLNNLLDDVQKKLDDALEREQNLKTENATLNSQLLGLANRGNGSSKGSSKGKLPLLPVAIGGGVGIFVIAVIVNLLSKRKGSATYRGAAAIGSGTRAAGSTVIGGLGAGLGAAGGVARRAGQTVAGGAASGFERAAVGLNWVAGKPSPRAVNGVEIPEGVQVAPVSDVSGRKKKKTNWELVRRNVLGGGEF